MQVIRYAVALACLSFTATSAVEAQPLAKRHQLELKIGFWNQTTDVRTYVEAGGVSTSVEASGGLGGIAYGHWLRENLAIQVSVSGMVADLKSQAGGGSVQSSTAVVAPILFGLKYYLPNSTLETSVRPFLKAAAGPFVGTQSSTRVGTLTSVQERTETAIGGYLGGGVDFILGRRIMLGVALGGNVHSDFNEPIGGSVNYSGPEFAFGISLLLGGGETAGT